MKKVTFGKKKGFTLLELLIVVVVLAVLAGLALPQYIKTVARSKEAEGWQVMATVRSAEMRYYAEWENYVNQTNFDLLDITDVNSPPQRYFGYTVAIALPTFTITADPSTGTKPCAGCRTLTLDDQGTRTEQ